jgi:iron donor protein CyaY
MTEQEFRIESDRALEDARRALMPLADELDFEIELQNGVMQVVFEEPAPAKFVISPNAPVRQLWVSAMSRSYKLPWSPEESVFALEGEALVPLLERLIRQQLA